MGRPIVRINRDRVADQVFNDLMSRILAGEFPPGEKLPAEHSLSESYGVSRASVRAALQRLGTLGLVESRVGEGTFARDGSLESLSREVSPLVARDSMTPYVTEFRELIERSSASLAVRRASDAELDHFVEVADGLLVIAKEGELGRYLDEDYEFHLALCKLSHNPLYEWMYGSIRDLFKLRIRSNLDKTAEIYPDALEASAQMHQLFARALRSRDEPGALALIDSIVNLSASADSASQG